MRVGKTENNGVNPLPSQNPQKTSSSDLTQLKHIDAAKRAPRPNPPTVSSDMSQHNVKHEPGNGLYSILQTVVLKTQSEKIEDLAGKTLGATPQTPTNKKRPLDISINPVFAEGTRLFAIKKIA